MKKINKKNILFLLVFIILTYNVIYQVFKIQIPFVSETDIMKDDIKKYDVLLLKKVNYEINDIVVFNYNNQTRIAKITNKNVDKFTLKANQNLYCYENINSDKIIGKVTKKIDKVGIIFVILRSKIITFLLLILFIIIFVKNEISRKKSLIRKKSRKV